MGIKHQGLFTSLWLKLWGFICLMNGRGQPSAQGFICHWEQKTLGCGDVKMTNSPTLPRWYFIATVSSGGREGEGRERTVHMLSGNG